MPRRSSARPSATPPRTGRARRRRRQRLVAAARAGAAAARADAAGQRLADAERQRERVLADGRAEADRIARVAAERMPDLLDEVVRRVLAQARPAGGGPQR